MKLSSRLLAALAVLALLFVPATSLADDDDDKGPVAGDVSVSAIGQDTARVTATLTLPTKSPAAYWFEYGTSAALGTQTPAASATHDDDDSQHRVVVSRTLTGLTAGTPYHVRLVAAGSGGRDDGTVATFTTTAASTVGPPADPAAPTTPADPSPQPPHGPALGASFVAAAEQGHVRVRLPGGERYVDLPRAASLPVGTIVDARRGTIALTTALPGGDEQQGIFWGARFKVRQPAAGAGRTDLHLRGGGLAACPRRGDRTLASAAATKPRRRLWGKDRGGRFRTHGRDSVTTVRGTQWSVTDRCDGTVTRVTEGAVDVRVKRTGRVVRLAAGERFLAKRKP